MHKRNGLKDWPSALFSLGLPLGLYYIWYRGQCLKGLVKCSPNYSSMLLPLALSLMIYFSLIVYVDFFRKLTARKLKKKIPKSRVLVLICFIVYISLILLGFCQSGGMPFN